MPGRTAKNFRPFGRMTKENQFTLFWCAVQALFLGPRSFTSSTRKKRLGGSTLYNLAGRKSRVGVNASFKCERLNSPAKRGAGLRAQGAHDQQRNLNQHLCFAGACHTLHV